METCKLDVTGDLFDLVDFSEATLFFTLPEIPENHIAMEVWGITLMKGSYDSVEDFYISGKAKITIKDVGGGTLDAAMYNGKQWLKHENGETIRLKNEWHINSNKDQYTYILGGVLVAPSAYVELKIKALGEASLLFNLSDCIPVRDYVKDPQKYCYQGAEKTI